jgi:hypothetical protein
MTYQEERATKIKEILHATGVLALAARNVVGGVDMSGFAVVPANVYSIGEAARKIDAALRVYDTLILELHKFDKDTKNV